MVAENVDVTAEESVPQRVEYTIVVSPVKRMEIVAEKTALKVKIKSFISAFVAVNDRIIVLNQKPLF